MLYAIATSQKSIDQKGLQDLYISNNYYDQQKNSDIYESAPQISATK